MGHRPPTPCRPRLPIPHAPRHSGPPPVIPAKAGNHAPPNPQGRGPRLSPPPSFRRKPGSTQPSPPTDPQPRPVIPAPPRHSGESRKPRPPNHPPTPPLRHSGESRNPRTLNPQGRGPRLSPLPVIPAKAGNHVTLAANLPHPRQPHPPSFRRKPETTSPSPQPTPPPPTPYPPSFRRKPVGTWTPASAGETGGGPRPAR